MSGENATDALYARIYEGGRQRGLAECPCGGNPGADDLLTYEDGLRDCATTHGGIRWRGVEAALVAVALLGLVAIGLRGRP